MTGQGRSQLHPNAGEEAPPHIPVLVDAVLAALAPRDDALYVDATFGRGGYSVALLGAARCQVFASTATPTPCATGANWSSGTAGG